MMTDTDQQRILLGQVIAKAWGDPVFRQALIEDPRAVLRAADVEIPEEQAVTVVEDTRSHRHLVIPADVTDEVRPQVVALLTAALPLPAGTQVTLHQNSADERFLVLPAPLDEQDALPEDALGMVVGGMGGNGGDGGIVVGGTGGNGGSASLGLLPGAGGGIGWIG